MAERERNPVSITKDIISMAQDTKPATTPNDTEPDDDGNLHYYSGGEVKELAGTRVAPVLWIFYGGLIVLLLVVIVGYFTGHRDFSGLTRPAGLSAAEQGQMQSQLNANSAGLGFQTADQLDITRIPRPAGETVETAIDKGADVYQTYCIGCHGQNQDGNGVNAAALNPKPRNLRDAPFMQAMSYQRIYTSVHKGVPGTAMPRWENSLSEDQMKNAIAYVLSLSAPKPAAGATNAAAGSTTNAGGTQQYMGQSTQTSPTPITPPINGNPAASTSTAPPSSSGQPTPGTTNSTAPAANGTENSAAPAGPGTAAPGQPGTKPATP